MCEIFPKKASAIEILLHIFRRVLKKRLAIISKVKSFVICCICFDVGNKFSILFDDDDDDDKFHF